MRSMRRPRETINRVLWRGDANQVGSRCMNCRISSKLFIYVRFSDLVDRDTASCDLVIVLGTSLQVAPICMIPGEHKLS